MTFSGCGVAGVLRFAGHPRDTPGLPDVRRMTDALRHRGPNGEGIWDGGEVVLGHRRLSFLDLGSGGAQPMTRGDSTLVYNGELYNFAELRTELSGLGHRFASGSDTEVVLRAWTQWGARALDRFHGMYAFALWDARQHRLVLARDRIGIKPLYFHRGDGFVAFASEVEALLRCRRIPRRPDVDAVHDQLLRSSTLEVDRTRTLVRGVRAVAPATWMSIDVEGRERTERYWALPGVEPAGDADGDAVAELRGLVEHGVRSMTTADVPIGAFLSGGLDSSVITTIAAADRPITAVTVAYAERAEDVPSEAGNEDLRYSRLLAGQLAGRVEHRVRVRGHAVSLPDIDDVCDLATFCDDVRHVSILGNYRSVASLGLRGVLNGQGADETMGGYVGMDSFVRNILDIREPALATFARLPAARQVQGLSRAVLARRADAHREVLDFHAGLPGSPLEKAHRLLVHTQLSRIVQFEDFLSMRASVEGRFPFLDHRLVEFVFRQPFDRHVDTVRRQGKTLLRRATAPLLPDALTARPKQKFPYPGLASLQRSLEVLAGEHEPEIRGDDLVSEVFDLPGPGRLATLPPDSLWVLLSLWRWHDRLRTLDTRRADALAVA
ncbi:asparagine synthase (glutamine-hydrolyzing) [Amycolatopsis sp. NPDC088138]|uniref:asparagine synthase (glutamine-hydrolyzing) n=1 Tax=Amycolatopsis sp. NPDC088138 TaxID=3363938 RepID=UPI0038159EB8